MLCLIFFPVISTGQIIWESIYSSSPGFFGDVYFLNQFEGWHTRWSVGSGVYHSTDGGYTWELQVAMNPYCHTVFFLNDTLGWCGTHGEIGRTTNGGISWEFYSNNIDASVRDIVFIDANEGWCIGGNSNAVPYLDEYFICHTADGGINWEVQKYTQAEAYYLNRICAVNSDTLAATGILDTIFVTYDGGSHWTGVTPDSIGRMYGIAYNGQGRFIACGHDSYAKIIISDDFGLSWQTSVLDTICEGTLLDVSFVDPLNGICTGSAGSFITYDGGSSWQYIPTSNTMFSVHFIEPYLVYASAMTYDIYRFVDTGISPPDTIESLRIEIESINPVLSWQSVITDIFGYPIDISNYDLYRGDNPYFAASSTSYIGSADTCNFIDPEVNILSNNNVFYKVKSNR